MRVTAAMQQELTRMLVACGSVHIYTEPPIDNNRAVDEWFTLACGKPSPYYVDVRALLSSGTSLRRVTNLLDAAMPPEEKLFGGPPYASLSLAAALAMERQGRWLYWRKQEKGHGIDTPLVGTYMAGEIVALVEDVSTTGGSQCDAIERLRAAGLVVNNAVVLIDRQEGGRQALEALGVTQIPVLTARALLTACVEQRVWTPEVVGVVRRYVDEQTQP